MRALFSLARKEQPSVIFFDEIDAMMSARKVRYVQEASCITHMHNYLMIWYTVYCMHLL